MNKISAKKRYKTKVKIKISGPHICKICGLEFKSASGIASHILNKHNGMLYQDYLLNYFDIDVNKINTEWDSKKEERKILKSIKLSNIQNNIIGTKKERYNTKQYQNFRNSMKDVFSLFWFIKKYGEIEGNVKYRERCNNISKTTFFNDYNSRNKMNWSAVSQKLFWKLYKIIEKRFNKIYFGELNHEFSCGIHSTNFDFVVDDIKKVIEFNGDKFHANPKMYNSLDVPLKFLNKKAEDIWKEDDNKIQKLKNNGYDLKVIWESDYKKNEKQVLDECLNFLNI